MLIEFIVSSIIVILFLILLGVYYNRNKCPPGCSGPSGPDCPDPSCPEVDCNSCEVDISKLTQEQIKSIISSNVTEGDGVTLSGNQCIVDVSGLTQGQINSIITKGDGVMLDGRTCVVDVSKLTQDQIQALVDSQLSKLSQEQITSIISSNVTKGKGVKLENNQCSVDVSNLTENQINQLSQSQLQNLTPEQISSIITRDQGVILDDKTCLVDVGGLSTEQLSNLTENQINQLGICGEGTIYNNTQKKCLPNYEKIVCGEDTTQQNISGTQTCTSDYRKILCNSGNDSDNCLLFYMNSNSTTDIPRTGIWRFDKTDNSLKILPDEDQVLNLELSSDGKILVNTNQVLIYEDGKYIAPTSTGRSTIYTLNSICADSCKYDSIRDYLIN